MKLLYLTLESIFKARLISLIFLSASLGVGVVILLIIALSYLINQFFFDFDWFILSTVVHWLVSLVTTYFGWFLLPIFIYLIASFFSDFVISRIESTYYPKRIVNKKSGVWPGFANDIVFILKALLLNLLVLPLYIFGIGTLVSILLNGYLLGKELFNTVLTYHQFKISERMNLYYENKSKIFLIGLLVSILAIIPMLNIFSPVLATALMVHFFHHIYKNHNTDNLAKQESDLKKLKSIDNY